MQMKLSNKCRLIPKEYQINSSYQTVVQFESKLISIRTAKLYYIRTYYQLQGEFLKSKVKTSEVK